MTPLALTGRKALVTGAAGGIGLAITEHLASLGAVVAAADRDESRLNCAIGQLALNVSRLPGDISLEAEAECKHPA